MSIEDIIIHLQLHTSILGHFAFNSSYTFLYKNIENFGNLRTFLTFLILSLKLFLKCSYFQHFLGILAKIPEKLHVIKFVKPINFLNMFLTFWPLKPYVLIYFVLIKKRVLDRKGKGQHFLCLEVFEFMIVVEIYFQISPKVESELIL